MGEWFSGKVGVVNVLLFCGGIVLKVGKSFSKGDVVDLVMFM